MAKKVRISDGRDEQKIELSGSNDAWLVRDAGGSGWLVVADAITVAIGHSTPEAAIAAAEQYVKTQAFADAMDDLRARVQR